MATQDVKIRITALDKVSTPLKKIGAGLRLLTKPLLNMKTALVGVLGAGGLTLLVRQSLLATDALSKTASKIGTTTEALSGLQYAGKLTGVEVNTMNMALQRFSRRASEAAQGTGEAKGAIRELGIDARELVKLPLDERMLVLADAFQGVQSESDKLRIAFKLFDSEGAALVNTLSQGRGGLAAMLGEAKALGVVMSSEAAEGVEAANDEFLKLNSIFKGILDQTTAALAPALKFIVESISKALIKFGEAQGGFAEIGKKIATNLVNGFRIAGETVIEGINGIIDAVNRVKRFNLSFKVEAAQGDIRSLSKDVRLAQKAVQQLQEQANGTREAVDFDVWFEYGRNIDKAREALASNTQELETALQTLARLKSGINDIDPLTLEGITGFTSSEIEKFFSGLTNSIKEVNLELGKAPVSGDGNIVNKYLESLEQLNRQLPQSEDLVSSFANNTMNSFTTGFTNAITGAEKFSDAIRNMAKNVIDDLIRMAIQYYITQQIFGAIVGAFSPAPTPTTTTGTGGGGGGTLTGMSFNGGGFTGYGSRSGGVDGKGGFPAILHPNESVIDHTKGGDSGITIVQNINVTTGVQQTVRAEIANLLPQISNAAKSAVADARMRGGGFSKAMVGA
jgi:hypothetical protein